MLNVSSYSAKMNVLSTQNALFQSSFVIILLLISPAFIAGDGDMISKLFSGYDKATRPDFEKGNPRPSIQVSISNPLEISKRLIWNSEYTVIFDNYGETHGSPGSSTVPLP
ncbi:hypothetical protein ACROYT_G032799 [Oculina patagonica]